MSILSKRPLLSLCFSFAAGMLLSALAVLNDLPKFLIAFFLFLPPTLLFLLFFLQKRTWVYPLLLSAVFLFGFFRGVTYESTHLRAFREAKPGSVFTFSGEVLTEEETDRDSTRCLLRGSVSGTHGKDILFYCDFYGEERPERGEWIEATVSPYVTEQAASFYGQGVAGYASCRSLFRVTGRADETLAYRARTLLITLREGAEERIEEAGGPLYSALLLGREEALSPADRLAFRRIGASHLLSVSGLHLVIVCSFFVLLLSFLAVPRILRFFLVLLLIFGYGALAGFPLPLLRAAVMLLCVELSRVARRIPDSMTSLALALALLLLFSPSSVYSIGLWLSFAATLGIVVSASVFPEMMARKQKNASRLLLYIRASLLTTLGATLFTLVLTLFFFGEFSLISPLSNLILGPLTTLILFLGVFLLPLGRIPLLSEASHLLGEATLSLVRLLSSPSDLLVPLGEPVVQAGILLSLSLLAGALLFPIRLKERAGEERRERRKRERRLLRTLYLSSSGGVLLFLLIALMITANIKSFVYKKSNFSDIMLCQNGFSVDLILVSGDSDQEHELLALLQENNLCEVDKLYLAGDPERSIQTACELSKRVSVRKVCLLSPAPPEGSAALALLPEAEREGRFRVSYDDTPTEEGAFDLLSYHTRQRGDLHRDEFAFSLLLSGKKLLYATSDYLSRTEEEGRNRLTGEADYLIIGAYPRMSAEGALLFPGEKTTVIEAYPSVFRYHPKSNPREILSPTVFSLVFP